MHTDMNNSRKKSHQLHLDTDPFERIRSGVKTVECRLLDEKRKSYTVGDSLQFIHRGDGSETIVATIIYLHKEKSFQDLFRNYALQTKVGNTDTQYLVDGMTKYYSKEEQIKFGVVGIEFVINGT